MRNLVAEECEFFVRRNAQELEKSEGGEAHGDGVMWEEKEYEMDSLIFT